MTVSPLTRLLVAPVAMALLFGVSPAGAGEGKWSQGQGLHCRIVPTLKANGVLVNVVMCGKFGV